VRFFKPEKEAPLENPKGEGKKGLGHGELFEGTPIMELIAFPDPDKYIRMIKEICDRDGTDHRVGRPKSLEELGKGIKLQMRTKE